TIHQASQAKPSRPVATKAHCQPQCRVTQGTTRGVRSAPTFVPELKMPVASARSWRGNHSATVLMAAGKLPASPRPSAKRAAANPAAAPTSMTIDGANVAGFARGSLSKTVGKNNPGNQLAAACAIAATLHTP